MADLPYAEVALPVPVFQTYYYGVPDDLQTKVTPGCRILVPFGPKLQTGIVLRRVDSLEIDPARLKPVLQVLDNEALVSGRMLELARWVSEYYLTPLGETLRVFLPPGLNVGTVTMVRLTQMGQEALLSQNAQISPQRRAVLQLIRERNTTTVRYVRRRLKVKSIYGLLSTLQSHRWIELFQRTAPPRVKEKFQQGVILTEEGRAVLQNLTGGDGRSEGAIKLTEKQRRALCFLVEFRPPVLKTALLRQGNVTAGVLKSMAARGWIEIMDMQMRRRPFQDEPYAAPKSFTLTREQSGALKAIEGELDRGKHRSILLHGVTGSGKTEIYVRAAKKVLRENGQVLVLVPEIGLTPAAWQVFRANFREQVALLHSGLSGGERHDEWMRVKRGEACVVLGTRSAVFAPLDRLRLIIIDEEHDASYKQDETPRYHAREVALSRAALEGAVVVLGSATPSVEVYSRAADNHDWLQIRLEKRIMDRPLASVEIVDMQEEFLRYGPSRTISSSLKLAMEKRLELGQQVVLLLNRRGYAPCLLCRSCGFVLRCDHCSVGMTYHQSQRLMLCHYCNRVKDLPKVCPQCQARFIFYVGEGTERLVEVVQKLFPGAVVDRMDSDVTSRKGSYFRILNAFARGKTQVLIGTQMIAKGHDFPNVTLAGVVAADQALNLPDFRAAERTFQLLTQVAGRSGRGEALGEVVVQTRFPNHYSLKYACRQDYLGFYRHEMEHRRTMMYPPFSSLANLVMKGPDKEKVVRFADRVGRELLKVRREQRLERGVRILGPNPAPLEKVKDNFRYQILIKSIVREELRQLLKSTLKRLSKARAGTANLVVDLDPLNLL